MKLYELLITLIGAWQTSNPALVDDIGNAVPEKPEKEHKSNEERDAQV